jgi:hypothetical protein
MFFRLLTLYLLGTGLNGVHIVDSPLAIGRDNIRDEINVSYTVEC